MPILRFLWLALRPISKLESGVGWWDVLNLMGLMAYPSVGFAVKWSEVFENANLVWFMGIPALLFLIAGIKLQFKLAKFENTMPKLHAELLSFPQSGRSIVMDGEKDVFSPQKGYAKIVVKNAGGLLKDCIGTVKGISTVDVRKGQVQVLPLAFTPAALAWDGGELRANVPNDGVGRLLRLAYLDQNRPGRWALAIEEANRPDYPIGWYRIDVVISSESQEISALQVEVALGLGDRVSPPSGLNLWPWDK